MATTRGVSGTSVILEEHADLLGLFLRHDQPLELIDLQTPPSAAAALAATLLSPGKRAKTTMTTSTFSSSTYLRRFELNSKLFAINEPYLMKTERDSLVKLINESEATENGTTKVTPTATAKNQQPNGTAQSKTVQNRAKKRKKALTKKVGYLEQNLANEDERALANKIIDQCLLSLSATTPKTTTTAKSPSKRKVSATSTTTFLSEKKTDHLLLRHINGDTAIANGDAQAFVQSLFRNRFESLNYRSKLLCNPYSRVLRVKFGISNYLIPSRCSFAGIDICEGIQKLTTDFRAGSFRIRGSSRGDPFYVVLDPAWDNNKSVKRKKAYETVSMDYLRRMCRDLAAFLDLVQQSKDLEEAAREEAIATPPTRPSIITAIWTTKADKDFVLEEMHSLLGVQASYDLKWHKVTTSGCPVKIHGGLEYLIIAERWSKTVPSPTTQRSLRSGLLVSVPSAVHSHKPSLVPIFRKLYSSSPVSTNLDQQVTTTTTGNSRASRSPDYATEHQGNYSLAPEEIISPLMGVELFARYLQTGFHSIGFECIKLQNEELFTSSIVVE